MRSEMSKYLEASTDIQNLLLGIRRTCFPAAVIEQAGNIAKINAGSLPSVEKLTLVQVNKVRYRERKDIKYSMTSLFSALHGTAQPIVFILTSNKISTAIYLGFWDTEGNSESHSEDLHAAIKGFIPGSEFTQVKDSKDIISSITKLQHVNALVGVPSEKQTFQDEKRNNPFEYGIERFADAMTNDQYALFITATPVNIESAAEYFERLSVLLDYVHRLAKSSEQYSSGTQEGKNIQFGENSGGSEQSGESSGSNESAPESPWVLKRWGLGVKKFFAGGPAPTKQAGTQIGKQFTEGTTWGTTASVSINTGSSETASSTLEKMNHQAVFAEELLKMLQGRLKNGIGEGLWKTNVLLLSDRNASVEKGCNILKGMWAGGQSHQDPIRSIELTDLFPNSSKNKIDNALILMNHRLFEEHPLGIAYSGGYTWLTSGELALEANLPYYELPDLSSENIIEYGRFLPTYDKLKQIELGKLVDRNINTDTPVCMDTFRLNRHLFVTGLTGAGKSNTIRAVLLELARLGIPFLVIEPVKSEYRRLNQELGKRFKEGNSKFDHLDVFSLSGQGAEKLVLNPFAFEIRPEEDMATALICHIDRLKAVFNSSLGMYSSMPYILEEMIYKAYVNAGWNIETGENSFFEIARSLLGLPQNSELRNLFLPRLSDLTALVDEAMKGFFPKDSDYGISLVGALKSRLNSLSRGAKGLLLNQRLSLPIQALLDHPCVIELESFADNDEKAFIMALLLSRIYEFRAGKLDNYLRHVLVIEEAHRLLSKPPQTGEYSSNSRGKSVEVFADMLAEIRAYGQGIVIADQIPAKLIPDVIKNTDIKIVHRLMAKEDREAVGTAMNLDEKQIKDLNRATPGLATVSFDGLNSPIRVQIREVPLRTVYEERTTDIEHIDTMSEYKQNVFLSIPAGKCVSPIKKSQKSYWLVLRLFFIAAICEDNKILIKFRSLLSQKNASNKYNAEFDTDELWPCVAEAAHTLMADLCSVGVVPGEAGILISSFISFAHPWSISSTFNTKFEAFVAFVKKDGLLFSGQGEQKGDFLSFMLQLYADRSGFQEKVIQALVNSSPENWASLQDALMFYISDMTYGLVPKDDAISKILISLRLIKCMRTDDDDLRKKAGRAYGALRQMLPDANKILVTQEWEYK